MSRQPLVKFGPAIVEKPAAPKKTVAPKKVRPADIRSLRCKTCEVTFKADISTGKVACPNCNPAPRENQIKKNLELAKAFFTTFSRRFSGISGKMKGSSENAKRLGGVAVVAAVAITGVFALISLATRADRVTRDVSQITLQAGESRMVPVEVPKGLEWVDYAVKDAGVLDIDLGLDQPKQGLVHILLTGIAEGKTTWRVRFGGNHVKEFRTDVLPRQIVLDRSPEERARAKEMVEGGARALVLFKTTGDPTHLRKSMDLHEEARVILRHAQFAGVDDTRKDAELQYQESYKEWKAEVDRAAVSLDVAKMEEDQKKVRQSLRRLLDLTNETSPEYQRYKTELEYKYLLKRKKQKA